MLLNLLLIFCGGYTFAVGVINLAIGFFYQKDRSYLFFGLISLFSSVFLLTQIPAISSQMPSSLTDTVSIITAVVFYTLFAWFIGEYTGYKKVFVQRLITFATNIVLVLYFVVKAGAISWELWESIAHITILSISVYGFYAGMKGLRNSSVVWRLIYLFSMLVLFIVTILVGLSLSLNIDLILDPEGYISPLDFFPVYFSLIIGSKMSHDVVRSYQLESEIMRKDRDWSNLMDTINLLVVKLDLQGRIIWVNSFFTKFTGYKAEDIKGKNWFELMLFKSDKKEIQSTFQTLIQGKDIPVYQNQIHTISGDAKSIQWSNLRLQDADENIAGILSVGADVTDSENAFAEIKSLKDRLEKENLQLKEEVELKYYSNEIIGQSAPLLYVLKRAHQVADTNSTVLLEGETGVGKELFANLIHLNSKRRHRPFIKVNCASLPRELIESELFGHEKGAFTGALKTRIGRFELANQGTIFLDEIGELPLDLQPKLLRVLQSGEFERIGSEKTIKVDVRIIAATNRDLNEEVEKGHFRQDLFFRLNVYPITIPPLRQRIEDLPMLIRYFAQKLGRKIGKKIDHISKSDIQTLQSYDWPGNIRELENVIERAIINSAGENLVIDKSQLKSSFKSERENKRTVKQESLDETQKKHIVTVLEECSWKINGQNGAAEKLGIPPSTLRSKMKKLNISRP